MSSFDSLNDTFDIVPTEVDAKPVKVKPVQSKGEDRWRSCEDGVAVTRKRFA